MSDRKSSSSRKRDRSRSRSPRRDRDRSRDRDRDRRDERKSSRKDKKRHRSRSRSKSPSRRHSSSSSSSRRDAPRREVAPPAAEKADSISQRALSSTNTYLMSEDDRKAQRDAEQAVLDEEMRKRRERVKAWQEAKAAAAAAAAQATDSSANNGDTVATAAEGGTAEAYAQERINAPDTDKWTLEDDEEEEEEPDGSAPPPDTAGLDALPPLAPLGDMTVLPGEADEGNAEDDDAVFSTVGPIQNKARRQSAIALNLKPHVASSAPAATKVDAPAAVTLSVAQALEASAAAVKPIHIPTVKLAAVTVPVATWKKNRFASVKDSSSESATTAPASSSVAMEISPAAGEADDFDPLDAFMTDLQDGGDVAEQNLDTAFLRLKEKPPQRIPDASVDNDSDDSSDSDVNPYGSNFITLDQIMGSSVIDSAEAKSDKKPKAGRKGLLQRSVSAGWESDSAMSTSQYNEDETPEEREAREEAERQEFINAIKRARELEEEEEKAREEEQRRALEENEVRVGQDGAAAEDIKKKKGHRDDDLGRVFASEGDVMDDYEIEAKKKSALELLEEQKRSKELKAVDHSQVQYLPFRKNLYIVPRSLANLSDEEVKMKRDLLHIKVRGKQCPCSVDTWEQCGLSDRVLEVIEKSDFKAPFAIQQQAIPAIMCGRDVIGVAKTGSGKTLAFLLPMIRHIMDQPPLGDAEGPIGLIMAPARELAFQIYNEAKKFCRPLGLRAACVYGGAGIAEQIADLKRGAAIVVCTPGRMIDILTMQAGKLVSFRRVTMVVMDEADRMFDMGFEPQIKMITQNIRPDRQTVLFSATFPKQIEKLAKTILKLPLEIVVGDRSVANKDITQYVEIHDEDEKFLRLLQLLGIWYERGSVLIFVDKQDKCDQLFQDLLKAGYPSLSLHGGKDQVDRDHTLHEFKTLIKTVMVATSVAGRGLDVPEIVCVINYNCPNHLEDYVHRIGRTGRAGRKGTAYTFISPTEDQYSPLMCKALEQAEQPIPPELQAVADQFKEKVSKGEARWASGGFSANKGFSFDASEMNEAQKLASMQRRAYEIEQGIINPGDAQEEGDPGDDFFDDDEAGGLSTDADNIATTQSTDAVLANTPAPGGSGSFKDTVANLSSQALTPLERARALAAAMNRPQAPVAPQIQTSSGGNNFTPEAALARAKQIAMNMSVAGGDNETDYSKMHFSAEFEINDYPPQVRRKVTNRQTLDQVSEMTGVAIISRGSYIPPGRKLEPGEVKLYLFIEAPSELQVKQAKLEIQRLLDEEALRVSNQIGGMVNSSFGRYSVL